MNSREKTIVIIGNITDAEKTVLSSFVHYVNLNVFFTDHVVGIIEKAKQNDALQNVAGVVLFGDKPRTLEAVLTLLNPGTERPPVENISREISTDKPLTSEELTQVAIFLRSLTSQSDQ